MNKYALTGASYPMRLCGTELAAFSLNDADYVELDGYIQSKIIEIAQKQLDSLPSMARSELLQAAIKAAASTGWGTMEGIRIMYTTEGVLRLGWQMVRKGSRITWEDFSKLAHGKGTDDLKTSLLQIDECYTILHGDDEEAESQESAEGGSPSDPKST